MIIKYNKNLSDEELNKILLPAEMQMKIFEIDMMEHYVAKNIATYYNNDAIFDNESTEDLVKSAIQIFNLAYRNSLNIDKIKKILTNEYNLKITNDNPITIEKMS